MPATGMGCGGYGCVCYVGASLPALESLVRSKEENVYFVFLAAVGLKKNSMRRSSVRPNSSSRAAS